MNQENQLSVEQLLAALQRKGIPLPFEIGTFLVLQAAEQALVLEATEQGLPAPPVVGVSDVWLNDEGEVGVVATRPATSEKEACAALVVMLGDLLVRSAPGVPPMLLELVERGPSDGQWTLMRLRDDLEASLVPLNRGALRRVLARLLREVRKDAARAPTAPDARAVDRDLDALFGIESEDRDAAEPPPAGTDPEPPTLRYEGRQGQRVRDREDAPPDEAKAEEGARERARKASGEHGRPDSLDAFERDSTGRSGGGARIGIALGLCAAVLVTLYFAFGRDRVRGMLGMEGAAPGPEPAAERSPSKPEKPAPRYGELRVTSSPARAQVLLFVGAGPALATDLPVGVAHEFVAMADGMRPSRAVVPAGVAWQNEGGKPRYELALQLEDAGGKRASEELGPTRLPDDPGKPSGALGDVRIVTSPPGAKVYQLVGFTPDVRIENIALGGEPLELLVYAGGHGLARAVVRDADFKDRDGKRVAELDIALAKAR